MTDRIPLEEDYESIILLEDGFETVDLGTDLIIHRKTHQQAEQLKSQILQDAEKAQRLDERIKMYEKLNYITKDRWVYDMLKQIRDGVKT